MKQLTYYIELLKSASEDLSLSGKTLQEASIEHASLYLFYYDKLCELRRISDILQIEVDKQISIHTKKYTENHSISLGERQVTKYVLSESDIINAKRSLAEVDEIKNKYEGIVNAFMSRGYQLNNITKQRVAEIEEGLL